MVLVSKEDHVTVEVVGVIAMVVVEDIDLEVGDMVVVKVVRAIAGGMEVMVDMAVVVGGMVKVVVVEEEVGVTSVGMVLIFQGNVVKVVDLAAVVVVNMVERRQRRR
ncbi:hypothetical protein H5410_001859 [Solanum commersonii]|uniref:Uncharacterized protein n=1 Tax=Solanum commersonii TaxID=4109 RepID=A0A9J6B086_SOLCO|nr:hypothetical protein H5410_001859 [Solanum commersonii]